MAGHIVVIEDEPCIYELLDDVLSARGFTLTWVEHPNNVQSLDRGIEPDLILMDLMLPGLDGVKLAGQLREAGFSHTPIVALSASRIMLHFARESALFQDCLAKPFDLGALLDCVSYYAGRYVTPPALSPGESPRARVARQHGVRPVAIDTAVVPENTPPAGVLQAPPTVE